MTRNRITWTDGAVSCAYRGFIRDQELFLIEYRGMRRKGQADSPDRIYWEITSNLPFKPYGGCKFGTIDEAKMHAEWALDAFLRKIGAEWRTK